MFLMYSQLFIQSAGNFDGKKQILEVKPLVIGSLNNDIVLSTSRIFEKLRQLGGIFIVPKAQIFSHKTPNLKKFGASLII